MPCSGLLKAFLLLVLPDTLRNPFKWQTTIPKGNKLRDTGVVWLRKDWAFLDTFKASNSSGFYTINTLILEKNSPLDTMKTDALDTI